MTPELTKEILNGFAGALYEVLDDCNPSEVVAALQVDKSGKFANPETQFAFIMFCCGARFQKLRKADGL